MTSNIPGEKRYEVVFGDTFAMYTRKDMEEFIEPFKIRFQRNGIDPKQVFKGKRCFDAGCGNGRGSLFMLMHGASHVTAYDYSEKNVESTRSFAKQFGYDNIDAHQGSLVQIPFAEKYFDFVWCNGVIMHTERPNRCLSELARILHPGGQAWLYIYGSGGVYWRIIYHIREMVKHIPVHDCMAALKLFRYETRYIAEFVDDWYATWLRSYTHSDLSRRLKALGFAEPELLKFGMDYDTSHRIHTFSTPDEKALMGEGDLRYLLTKESDQVDDGGLLDEGEYGSSYAYPALIRDHIDPLFQKIIAVTKDRDWMKIALAAHIQRELRLLLTANQSFSLPALVEIIHGLIMNAESAVRL
jgi:ubiquinone/menaquinone biosynthesis C-methylase UbiE